jgi:DNA-binding transcriptional regulator YiaG
MNPPNHPNRSRREVRRGHNPDPAEIRQLRKEMELTREAFGNLVYAHARTVEAWEQGLRRMPAIAWELLCLLQAYPEVQHSQRLWREGRAF